MLIYAGGIGLGLTMGWLLAGVPVPPRTHHRGAVVAALASALVTSTAVAGPGAGLAFAVGLAAGLLARKAFERIPTLEGHS